MNIGIVTVWFERGAAIVSRAYRDALEKEHNVYIFARGGEYYAKDDPKWDQENVHWASRPLETFPTYIDWGEFQDWVKSYDLDIVIFNEQKSWDVLLRSNTLGVLVGAYVDYYTAQTVPFFDLYDFLLCNTKRHYSVFAHHPQAIYLPWGTDCSIFRPNKQIAPRNGAVTFFHSAGMGGIELRKGTDLVVRAFQHVRGNANLIIHSQVELANYSSVADLIQYDARIKLICETVGAPGLYHLGDVYVYPSRLEGIGLTIAEALASGLPVITTDCPPMNEFVLNDVNGKLVPVNNYRARSDQYFWPESICSESALADAMQAYVDKPDIVELHKRNARSWAVEHLDWSKNSAGLAGRLGEITKKRSQQTGLRSAVAKYERRIKADAYIRWAFANFKNGLRQDVIKHVAQGFVLDPSWVKNRGLWSILWKSLLRRKTVRI